MIHPGTRVSYVNQEIGDGVFATRDLPRGTIVWTQCRFDRVFAESEVARLDPAHRAVVDRYAHLDADRNRILCWDGGRYVNHSCRPNLRGLGPWMQVARVDIAAGDEITCDYAECNVETALVCACGASDCRGAIHGQDLLRFADLWDEEARSLALAAARVEQPLGPFLLEPREFTEWISGRVEIPSLRALCAFAEER